jgi:hypothetical protein
VAGTQAGRQQSRRMSWRSTLHPSRKMRREQGAASHALLLSSCGRALPFPSKSRASSSGRKSRSATRPKVWATRAAAQQRCSLPLAGSDPLWESRWWITPRHGGRGISSALDNNGKNLLTIGRGSSTVLQLLYRVQ